MTQPRTWLKPGPGVRITMVEESALHSVRPSLKTTKMLKPVPKQLNMQIYHIPGFIGRLRLYTILRFLCLCIF